MFEIKKQYRKTDLSYTIDTAPNEEIAKRRCREYVRMHPEASLRIWNASDRHWILWYPEDDLQ